MPFAGQGGRRRSVSRDLEAAAPALSRRRAQPRPFSVIPAKAAIRCTYLSFGGSWIRNGIIEAGRGFHLESPEPSASNIRSRKSLQRRYVHLIAAQAGIHAGTSAAVDRWIPAFAGMTGWSGGLLA